MAADPILGLATYCAAVLRAALPGGPYRLIGYSYGGSVAHVTARLLVEAGGEVSLLCLLDPDPSLTLKTQRGSLVTGAATHCWGVFPGRAMLVRSWERPLRQLAMPGLGWEHLCAGGVAVHDLPTTHWGVMAQPHIARVGELLSRWLDNQDEIISASAPKIFPVADVDLPFAPLPEALLRAREMLLSRRPADAWEALRASQPASLPVWAWDLAEAAIVGALLEQDWAVAEQSLAAAFASQSVSAASLAQWQMSAGRHAVGLSLLKVASSPRVRSDTLALAEALCAYNAGESDYAIAALARLNSLIADDADLAAVVFFELANGGWTDACVPYLRRALSAGSSAARAWVHGLLASLAKDRGDWTTVATEAAAAAEAYPGFFNYHPLLVHALVRLGNTEEAHRRHKEASAGFGPETPQRRLLDGALTASSEI